MKFELWNDGALLETFDTLDAAKVARCVIRFHKGKEYSMLGHSSSLDIKAVDWDEAPVLRVVEAIEK